MVAMLTRVCVCSVVRGAAAANRQLSLELGDVQEQLRNYHVFAELLVQVSMPSL